MTGNTFYFTLNIIGYFIVGSIFWSARKNSNKIRIRKKPLEMVKDFMLKDIDESEVNQMISKTGFKTNLVQYQMFRYIICIGGILLNIVVSMANTLPLPTGRILFLVILMVASSPQEKILKIKSPFMHIMDVLVRYSQGKKNIELYRAMSQLKNLAITKADRPPGSTYILEQLKKFTNVIRPTFTIMQSMWDRGQKDEACDYFQKSIGTPEAEAFASIIRKIDEMNPVELKQQMILFQEVIRRQRETEKVKKNEFRSNLIYGVVTISILTIFVNFLVVGFFVDMLTDLQNIG